MKRIYKITSFNINDPPNVIGGIAVVIANDADEASNFIKPENPPWEKNKVEHIGMTHDEMESGIVVMGY